MPGLSGIDVAQTLRQDPETAHIPIVMLSARGQETDKERGRSVGTSYLVKPFSPMELLRTIQEILGCSSEA
jgi:DNA-binding response OmpR family regulator